MTPVIDVIVIDDEPLARKKMESFIAKNPKLFLKGSFGDVPTAMHVIEQLSDPFVIFSDVQMPLLSGIDLIKSIKYRNIPVVLATAYDHYAVQGFELDVVDYLLKPFSYDRFAQSVERVLKRMHHTVDQKEDTCLMIRSEHRIEKVYPDQILYIEGMKDYVRIHLHGRKIVTLMRLSALLELLPAAYFMRIHKSFIVNTHFVDTYAKDYLLIGELRLPIGRSYKDKIKFK